MQSIKHENVVKFEEAWQDDRSNPPKIIIIMEYCDAGDLNVSLQN